LIFIQSLAKANRGRERDYELTEIEPVIRLFIESENKLSRPTTAGCISNDLRDKTQISLSECTMEQVLSELNFHYIKGENRYMYAKSEANIALGRPICARRWPTGWAQLSPPRGIPR
jgi:transposase